MCGINGIVGLENKTRGEDLMRRMNIAIAHRGPDAEGIYADENIVLGHRRLAIIDLSDDGKQPFISADGRYILVFNGEIYNYRELKSELKNYSFRTQTDTEVILAAFLEWGKSCVAYLNGMFAFAIWDKVEQELFLARDRVGIKPLYFTRTDQYFVFSSEIRAILQTGLIKRSIDQEALVDYLRYQTVHAPKTIVEGVMMIMPGHTLTLTDQEISVQEYWNAAKNHRTDAEFQEYDEVTKNIRELLQASVKRRMIADVPFGAFLSGGIDSSAVVALMSQVSDKPVSTFNISFAEEKFSEAKYARIIAEKYKTNHHEIKLQPDDLLHILPTALASMDHPSGDGPNTWLVSRVTKGAGITMALSGLGGDELFAGYDVFKRLYKLKSREWLQYFPMILRKSAAGMYKMVKPGVKSEKLQDFLRLEYFDHEHVYPLTRQVLSESTIMQLTRAKKLPPRSVFNIMQEGIGTGTRGADLFELSKVSYGEMYSYMQNVLLRDTDQMSMAHALEVRVPFLDHTLIEYVMGVRNTFKYPATPKKLLIDSLGDLLPDEIVNRPKMGFTFPWEQWMKRELRSFCEQRIYSLAQRGLLDEKALKDLWQSFLKDDPRVTWSRIWYLVVLEDYIASNIY